MPDIVVERVTEALNVQGKSLRGSQILLLGVSYKKNVGDVRESPALKVMHGLHRKGAQVSYHDPHVPQYVNGRGPMTSVPLDDGVIAAADCIVILTDHSGVPYDQVIRRAKMVVDTRNVLRDSDTPRLIRL
jgi:UDP-N-acetyl-D-glucosamine dehydrogenase